MSWQEIDEAEARFADGWLNALTAAGTVSEDGVEIEAASAVAIAGRFNLRAKPTCRPTEPPEPGVMELAANFVGAIGDWAKAGFPVAKASLYAARKAACDACEHWDANARLGLGRCTACKCSSLKRFLATAACPLGKWPAVDGAHPA